MGLFLRHRRKTRSRPRLRRSCFAFFAILGGVAGCVGHNGSYEICQVKSVEVRYTGLRHENYLAMCADAAGREGPISFSEPVHVGQQIEFSPYRVDEDSQVYHGYIHH